MAFILPLLDRYLASTSILSELYSTLTVYGPLLSVPLDDLRKNTALAHMRSVMLLDVVMKYESTFAALGSKITHEEQVQISDIL